MTVTCFQGHGRVKIKQTVAFLNVLRRQEHFLFLFSHYSKKFVDAFLRGKQAATTVPVCAFMTLGFLLNLFLAPGELHFLCLQCLLSKGILFPYLCIQ